MQGKREQVLSESASSLGGQNRAWASLWLHFTLQMMKWLRALTWTNQAGPGLEPTSVWFQDSQAFYHSPSDSRRRWARRSRNFCTCEIAQLCWAVTPWGTQAGDSLPGGGLSCCLQIHLVWTSEIRFSFKERFSSSLPEHDSIWLQFSSAHNLILLQHKEMRNQ